MLYITPLVVCTYLTTKSLHLLTAFIQFLFPLCPAFGNHKSELFFSFEFDEFCFLLFCQDHMACRILTLRPRKEPKPPAVETRGPNHWPAREVPLLPLFCSVTSSRVCGLSPPPDCELLEGSDLLHSCNPWGPSPALLYS